MGGDSERLEGLAVDLETGLPSTAGVPLGTDVLGAALLSVCGLDPAGVGVSAELLRAVLD